MNKTIRIGTRDSELALWQAKTVQAALADKGFESAIVPIKSAGDIELTKPLYEMGITGIFTKNLDIALLNNDIDIAVHSMKDVPTKLPNTVVQVAVLPRADVHDLLVVKNPSQAEDNTPPKGAIIATGSLRRKAQWLHRYPGGRVENLRGNVNTRLAKVEVSQWHGAVFAKAGLERLGKIPNGAYVLDWMIPAPAQGAIMIVAREDDTDVRAACALLNDENTALCTHIEREFLRVLEGGCTAPIGALAVVRKTLLTSYIDFKGVLLSVDGVQRLTVERSVKLSQADGLGPQCAHDIIDQGGRDIMDADAVDGEIHAIRMGMNKSENTAPSDLSSKQAAAKEASLKETTQKKTNTQTASENNENGDGRAVNLNRDDNVIRLETPTSIDAQTTIETEPSTAIDNVQNFLEGEILRTPNAPVDEYSPIIKLKHKPIEKIGSDHIPEGPIVVVSTRVLEPAHVHLTKGSIRLESLDFIQTKFIPIPPEAVRTDSMIITSQTTVRSLLDSFPRLNLKFKNIYCVGSKTTQLVEERLGRVLYTAQNARELTHYLTQNMSGRAITYFCSKIRRDDIPDVLNKHGIKVREVAAYDTQYTGQKIQKEFHGVMFYSPSAVRSFVQSNGTDAVAFCIGKTTAREAGVYFKNVQIAKQPSIENVIQMVNDYYA